MELKNGGGSEQALKKIMETTRERFGVDNAMQIDEIKKKKYLTSNLNYMVDIGVEQRTERLSMFPKARRKFLNS